jgi:hypothetical protein
MKAFLQGGYIGANQAINEEGRTVKESQRAARIGSG